MEKEKNTYKLNIGAPSIILLITVLGLVTFAILSVRAAYNELRLTRASTGAVSGYYEADAKVQRVLFELGEQLADLKESGVTDIGEAEERLLELPWVVSVDDSNIVCRVEVNSEAVIEVILEAVGGDYEKLEIISHRFVVEPMEGYSGSGLEVIDPVWIE